MYSTDDIMQFANLVAEIVDPDRIILFGSYAYGKPDDKSDIDLLVVKNGKDFTIDDEAKIATDVFYRRRQLGIHTRCDVFYRTDKQIQESVKKGGAFVDALQKGSVIYERVHQ